MAAARLMLLVQLGTTLPLVGLIWLVQIVSYPLFARVGASEFVDYHAAHSRLITRVVAPLMVAELGAALLGLHYVHPALGSACAWLGAALALATWLLTMFVSVPQHERLSRGFDLRAQRLLVRTNGWRTLVWSARAALLLWAVANEL